MKQGAAWLMAVLLTLCAGCEGGGSGASLDSGLAEQAFARGNGVAWLENKSDFWNIDSVVFSPGGPRGSDDGTYELAPGSYSLAVACSGDSWKDQWGRTHHDTKASQSVGIRVVRGQTVHVVLESTGYGNVFSLAVAE